MTETTPNLIPKNGMKKIVGNSPTTEKEIIIDKKLEVSKNKIYRETPEILEDILTQLKIISSKMSMTNVAKNVANPATTEEKKLTNEQLDFINNKKTLYQCTMCKDYLYVGGLTRCSCGQSIHLKPNGSYVLGGKTYLLRKLGKNDVLEYFKKYDAVQ